MTAPIEARTEQETSVKYMILIHSDMKFWETLPESEANRVLGNHYTVINETKATGELIRVEGLGNERTFIQFSNGVPAVTDGPFGEVKEQLAGLFLIDVDSLDRAKEIAGPLSEYGVVEIRPIMEEAGTEM
ncbi:MAG: YciI family protein [Chloroflexota bacterium]